MSVLGVQLKELVSAFFSDQVSREVLETAEQTGWHGPLWEMCGELGLGSLLVPENLGGVGGDWDDLFEIVHAVGRFTVPLPVVQDIVARSLLANTDIDMPEEPGVLIFGPDLTAAPWGRQLGWGLHQENDGKLILLRWDCKKAVNGENIASEPTDDISGAILDRVELAGNKLPEKGLAYIGALLNAGLIAGASLSALEKSSQYTNERQQFGRSLSKFQSVQHSIARMAEAVASIEAITRLAFHRMNSVQWAENAADDARLTIAAAKYRASLCADTVCSLAHQMHGAMGFTYEYDLHFLTRRLWGWRVDCGGADYWSTQLGKLALDHSADELWCKLTSVQ